MGKQPRVSQARDVVQSPLSSASHHKIINLSRDDKAKSFFVSQLPDQRGKSVAEIAYGLAPYPLESKLKNSAHHIKIDQSASVPTERFLTSSENVPAREKSRLDTIVFNATLSEGNGPPRKCNLEVLCQTLEHYLKDLGRRLKDSGRIFLCFSTDLALDSLHTHIIENKLFLAHTTHEVGSKTTHYLYELKSIKFKNEVQEYIYDDDYEWFKKYQTFLRGGSVLKVGYGLGFASYFVSLFSAQVTSLDVVLNADALSDEVVLYEGSEIPFSKDSFDTVICTYTLHHTPSPEALFKELCRVSRANVVVIEETYQNFLQKLDVVYTCWQTNRRGGQKVAIQWGSYLSENRFATLFSGQGLELQQREQAPRRTFLVDLIIGSKPT